MRRPGLCSAWATACSGRWQGTPPTCPLSLPFPPLVLLVLLLVLLVLIQMMR